MDIMHAPKIAGGISIIYIHASTYTMYSQGIPLSICSNRFGLWNLRAQVYMYQCFSPISGTVLPKLDEANIDMYVQFFFQPKK